MPTITETLNRLATTFTVKDIMILCGNLVSAADERQAPLVSANNPEFDVIPIKSGDRITGYFERALAKSTSVNLNDVISDGTNLLDLVDIFERRQFSFVLGEQDITGFVHFSDLNHHLVKLTFYVMLEALERQTLELIPPSAERDYLMRNLPDRFKAIEDQYKRAGQAARSLLSYLNISDILRLAALAGRITVQANVPKMVKQVRDGAAHASDNLVSSYVDVTKLANVKRECLRILNVLSAGSKAKPSERESASA